MKDFSKLNELPAEVKVLIANGQALVEEAKAAMQNNDYDFDLTSKRELKTDIKNVEKNIQVIAKGKVSEKNIKKLENSIICLRTILNGLISFFTR